MKLPQIQQFKIKIAIQILYDFVDLLHTLILCPNGVKTWDSASFQHHGFRWIFLLIFLCQIKIHAVKVAFWVIHETLCDRNFKP